MKLARIVCFLFIVGSLAVATYGQTSVDPKVLVNLTDPAACGGSGQPLCYPGSPVPLVEPYGPSISLSFLYDPSNPLAKLTTLMLEFTNVPVAVLFNCQTDIWEMCSTGVASINSNGTYNVIFDLMGGPGPCEQNGGVPATCPGFLTSGQGFSITELPLISKTPEPASIILYGTGLLLIGAVLRRRWV